jgi:hypothetical protein
VRYELDVSASSSSVVASSGYRSDRVENDIPRLLLTDITYQRRLFTVITNQRVYMVQHLVTHHVNGSIWYNT